MKAIIIACKGQTKETFVNRLLYRELWPKEVSAQLCLVSTSSHGKGGALSGQCVLYIPSKRKFII